MSDIKELARRVRMAGRALARHGMVHAYGHCSARIDADTFLVSPPRPLGMVSVGEECSVASVNGPLPEGVLGEVRIHRDIYRRRPDVHGYAPFRGLPALPRHLRTQAHPSPGR